MQLVRWSFDQTISADPKIAKFGPSVRYNWNEKDKEKGIIKSM